MIASLAVAFTLAACASGAGGGADPADASVLPPPPDAALPGDPDAPLPDPPDASLPGTPDAGMMMGTPDAGPTCSPCQLVAQCGCVGTDACDLGGANPAQGTTACRAVTTPGMGTSTCNGATTCAPGYTCLGPTGEASCKKYCASDAQCEGGGGLCTVQITYNNMPIPGVKVCSPSCNPFTQAGCPSAWGCHVYYNQTESRNFTWCTATGAGGQGATCLDDGDCQGGFGCFCTDALCLSQKCLKTCQVSPAGGPACPGATSCTGLNPAATIGATTYGVCF